VRTSNPTKAVRLQQNRQRTRNRRKGRKIRGKLDQKKNHTQMQREDWKIKEKLD
jgi:hypothetical protein